MSQKTSDERDLLSGAQRKLPMMPIREMVIFPHMMAPFVVGRDSSVRALEEALTADRRIFLATRVPLRSASAEAGPFDIRVHCHTMILG